MLLFIMLLAAITMAVFGTFGLLRVTRASVIFLGVMIGGLVILHVFGDRIVTLANLGARFIQGGGFAAIAADDPAKALGEIISQSKSNPLIDPNSPAGFYLLVFYVFVLIGLALSSLRPFRLQGRFSFSGLLIGLVIGYIIAAYSVAVLFPECAILPVPVQLKGMTPLASSFGLLAAGAAGVSSRLLQALSSVANLPSVKWVVVGLIVVFIFMASRLSAKRG
jgi:hypothetical protein